MVDIELIWKKINHELTEEEELMFNNWLEESPAHRKYFRNAMNYYNNESESTQDSADILSAWEKVQKEINKPGRKVLRLVLTSVAAAGIIVAFFFIYNQSQKPPANLSVESVQPILPGSNRAVLVMDDGSLHTLDKNNVFVLREGNAIIESTGDKISYKGKEGEGIKEGDKIRYNTIHVPKGGEFFIKLSDGTQVWLNSSSTFRYPVHFTGNERRVELTGEAFFDVAQDIRSPFYVSSGNQMIKVLGTSFNIYSYHEDPFIYTTLVEGEVEIYLAGREDAVLMLSPDEQSCFNKEEEHIFKHEVETLIYTSWKDGRFIFRNEPLPDIMKTLSRWYDIDFVFTDKAKENIRFTGNLRRYEDFGDILSKIEKTDEVSFKVENHTVFIK